MNQRLRRAERKRAARDSHPPSSWGESEWVLVDSTVGSVAQMNGETSVDELAGNLWTSPHRV